MYYVCVLLGFKGDIMNARPPLLYRLQWVKFRFHQHDPVHIHRILHGNLFLCGGLKKQSVH